MNAPVELPEVICEYPEAIKPLRERILANLVMIAQMPAPTGLETGRVRFLLDRFVEAGLANATADEAGKRRRSSGWQAIRSDDPSGLPS